MIKKSILNMIIMLGCSTTPQFAIAGEVSSPLKDSADIELSPIKNGKSSTSSINTDTVKADHYIITVKDDNNNEKNYSLSVSSPGQSSVIKHIMKRSFWGSIKLVQTVGAITLTTLAYRNIETNILLPIVGGDADILIQLCQIIPGVDKPILIGGGLSILWLAKGSIEDFLKAIHAYRNRDKPILVVNIQDTQNPANNQSIMEDVTSTNDQSIQNAHTINDQDTQNSTSQQGSLANSSNNPEESAAAKAE